MSGKIMRVQQLELTHFRGIRHLTLDFTENVTVLVGVNGAGKTSILEAIRALLACLLREIRREVEGDPSRPEALGNNFDSAHLEARDILVGQRSMSLTLDAIVADQPLHWSIQAKSKLPGTLEWHADQDDVLALTRDLGKQITDEPLTALPLALYYAITYGTTRPFPTTLFLGREESTQNQLAAYTDSLSSRALSANSLIDWFRRREDYENERRLEDGSFRDAQLEVVRHVVKDLLPGFSDPRIRRQPTRMVIRKGDLELELTHLSDGERYLLTLGVDIARRLALANPMAKEPRQCSAIILIDEIETHLHPSWQRRVIPALARAFPNCQFIISTHSPQVLSNVKPECIYLLTQEDGELRVLRPEASFGRDSNRILEDIMGVDERPGDIKERLSEYFYLIDQGKMDEARSLRRELEALIGPDEPEFTRADALMRTRELLSR
jgi:predicted ATP-binding protein involved in virulence